MLRGFWKGNKSLLHLENLSSMDEILDDARNGRMFILVDDEERENEGDLVVPAQMAPPEAIHFMAKHGRGLLHADFANMYRGQTPVWNKK